MWIAAAVVAATAVGTGTFFWGRSSVDLDKPRQAGYDAGYSVGYNTGYDSGQTDGEASGYRSGYDAGKLDGCQGVFDTIDAQYVTAFDPNAYWSGDQYPGSYYYSRSSC